MKKTKIKGRCFVKSCRRKAKIKHECRTCEKHTILVCAIHGARGLQAIRRHPVNILRATVAALKGEDVF